MGNRFTVKIKRSDVVDANCNCAVAGLILGGHIRGAGSTVNEANACLRKCSAPCAGFSFQAWAKFCLRRGSEGECSKSCGEEGFHGVTR